MDIKSYQIGILKNHLKQWDFLISRLGNRDGVRQGTAISYDKPYISI